MSISAHDPEDEPDEREVEPHLAGVEGRQENDERQAHGGDGNAGRRVGEKTGRRNPHLRSSLFDAGRGAQASACR